MFSPLPSSRTSPGSAGARGASPATRPVVRPRSRAAGASATLSPSVRAGSDRLHPPQMPDSPIPRPAPRGVKPEVSVAIRVHSPPQLEAETTAVIDNHFSCEVLRTALRQSAFSRRQLQATAAAESEKAERDLLRLWQLVFDVEEEEAALSDKHAALSEVVKTHGALAALAHGLERLVSATAAVTPFLEEHCAYIAQRQCTISLDSRLHLDETKLAAQLQVLVLLQEITVGVDMNFRLTDDPAIAIGADVFNNVEHLAVISTKADALVQRALEEVPAHRRKSDCISASLLENFLVELTGEKSPISALYLPTLLSYDDNTKGSLS